MKIGRNSPCPCGSGKKYKHCCINKATPSFNFNAGSVVKRDPGSSSVSSSLMKTDINNINKVPDNPLLMTKTDEIYQPLRIHYQLFNKNKVLKIFSTLRCIDFDEQKQRWCWLYDDEAKNIKLNKPYSSIPKEFRPIIIGSFFIRAENRMHLDVRSIERAIAAILFFDKYIPRNVAKVETLDIVNRLFGSVDDIVDSFDIYFDREDIQQPIDPDQLLAKIKQVQSQTEDMEEKRRLAISYVEQEFDKPFAEVEKMPTNFYEDGISQLETSLRMRQSLAIKHWLGDKDYTMRDLIRDTLRKQLP